MSLWANTEAVAARLAESRADPKARLKLLQSIKDALDITATPDYDPWLRTMLPALLRILNECKTGFTESDTDHRIRATTLETLQRLPLTEPLKHHVKSLVSECIKCLSVDNEENGVLALKIIFECLKLFLPLLETEVVPLLGFVNTNFTQFEQTCKLHFNEQLNQFYNQLTAQLHAQQQQSVTEQQPVGNSDGSQPNNNGPALPPRQFVRCVESFKVTAECMPIIMVLLSAMPRMAEANLNALMPSMLRIMAQLAPKEPASPTNALLTLLNVPINTDNSDANNATSTNAVPQSSSDASLYRAILREREVRFRLALQDFYVCQSKCTTLLAQVARSSPFPVIVQNADKLAPMIVQLFQTIPGDFPLQRRELLSALRYLLLCEALKKPLVRMKEKLLDDKLLIGEGKAVTDTLRPLAYLTLTELITPCKGELSNHQISKLVYIYCRNLHDSSLPLGTQTISVRALLVLVDPVHKMCEQENSGGRVLGRSLLSRILQSIVQKFESLQHFIPRVFAALTENAAKIQSSVELNTNNVNHVQYPTVLTLPSAGSMSNGRGDDSDFNDDAVRELKSMVSLMMSCLKTVVWGLTAVKATHPQSGKKYSIPLEEEELTLLCRLIDSGMRCLKLFSTSVPSVLSPLTGQPTPAPTGPAQSSSDDGEKSVIDQFATIFTHLESRHFREVWVQRMEVLFLHLVERPSLLYLPQAFLNGVLTSANSSSVTAANQAQIARVFTDLVLAFLLRHLHQLSVPYYESQASQTLVHLFRLVFLSVDSTEAILRPYAVPLVSNIVRLMQQSKQPINYLMTLKHLFRSIGTNRFDTLYKELLPTIPELVTALTRMQTKNSLTQTRDLSIELSLTLPARLSTLLMYMPALLRSVVRALQSKDENVVKIGVRTLEFWIDNTNSQYLYPHIKPFIREFFTAITALLRPSPLSQQGTQALFVLGKFGGRARRFLIEEQQLEWKEGSDTGLSIPLRFVGHRDYFDFPLDNGIHEAHRLLSLAPSTPVLGAQLESITHAYFFLRTCLLALIDMRGDADRVWLQEGYKQYAAYNAEFKAQQAEADRVKFERKEEKRREAGKQREEHERKLRADKHEKEKLRRKAEREGQVFEEKETQDGNEKLTELPPVTAAESKPPSDAPALGDEELQALRARIIGAATRGTLRSLIVSTVFGAADASLFKANVDAVDFMRGLTVHFACVAAAAKPRSASTEGRDIDASVFAEALSQCFEDDHSERREVAIASMKVFLMSLISLIGAEAASERSVVSELLIHVTHACHSEQWEAKHSGCDGLALLVSLLPHDWCIANQGEIIKGFLASLSEEKTENTESTSVKANQQLDEFVTRICQSSIQQANAKQDDNAATAGTHAQPITVEPSASEAAVVSTETAVVVRSSSQPPGKVLVDERESSDLRHLIAILAPNLVTTVAPMREATQRLLSLYSTLTGRPLGEVLLSFRSSLLTYVQSKSLHLTPINVRIGYLSAAAFLLTSCQPPLVYSKELIYLIRVVLESVEPGESDPLALGYTPTTNRATRQAMQTKLRVECIYLINAALLPHEQVRRESEQYNAALQQHAEVCKKIAADTGKELNDPSLVFPKPPPDNPHREWRDKCLRLLFRSLLSRSPAVNSAARKGLQQANLGENKISKELMSSTIRSILTNLADYRKLTVTLLEGLARLLEVLSSSFNVTLGEKLLEHAGRFATTDSIIKMREETLKDQTGALIRLKPEEEVRIPLLILELFPLLPLGHEGKFTEQLIMLVVKLEDILAQLNCQGLAQLPTNLVVPPTPPLSLPTMPSASKVNLTLTAPSPYRPPLIAFLNKHPRKSVEFFLRSLHRKRIALLFCSLLKYAEAEPLREQLVMDTEQFMFWTFNYNREAAEQHVARQQQQAHQHQQQQQQQQINNTNGTTTQPTSSADATPQSQLQNATPVPTDAAAQPVPADKPATVNGEATDANGNVVMVDVNVAISVPSPSPDAIVPGDAAVTTTAAATAPAGPVGPLHAPTSGNLYVEWEERIIQGVNVAAIITSSRPEFVTPKVLRALCEIWESKPRISRLMREESVPLHHIDETRALVLTMLNYSRAHHDDPQVIWKMLSAFKLRSLTDFAFLIDYFETEVTRDWSIEEQRSLIKACLKLGELPSSSHMSRTRAWRYVIRPLLKHSLTKRQPLPESQVREQQRIEYERRKLLEQTNIDSVNASGGDDPAMKTSESGGEKDVVNNYPPVWQPEDLLDDELLQAMLKIFNAEQRPCGPNQDDDYRVELLRADSLLIHYLSLELIAHRGTLVTFAWSHLKSENPLTKQWAHVAMARFIASPNFQTPSSFCADLYTQLLKSHAAEGRFLYNKALDVLVPSLPVRLEVEPDNPNSGWIRVTKRTVSEESQNLPLLQHVYSVMLRHPHLFYPSRALFAPNIVASLTKLASPQGRSLDNRRVSVQLVELLVAWDKQAMFEHQQHQHQQGTTVSDDSQPMELGESPTKRRAVTAVNEEDNDMPTTAPMQQDQTAAPSSPPPLQAAGAELVSAPSLSSSVNPWSSLSFATGASPSSVESVLTFLCRLSLTTCEGESRPLCKRVLKLLRDACELWREVGVEVKLQYLDKILSGVSASHDMTVLHATTMEILTSLFRHSDPAYVSQPVNAAFTDKLIVNCFNAKQLNPALKDGLCELMSVILKAHPMATVVANQSPYFAELNKFYKNVREIILSGLKSVESKTHSIYLQMALLCVVHDNYPSFVDQNLVLVFKSMQKLVKDALARPTQLAQQQSSRTAGMPTMNSEERVRHVLTTDSARKIILLLFEHIHSMAGEMKKHFVSSLSMIAQQSTDLSLVMELEKQVDGWLINDTNAANNYLEGSGSGVSGGQLSAKDKCGLLSKIASREHERHYSDIMHACLNTTLALFRQSPRRPEYIPRLQRLFLQGLRCDDDPALRHSFKSILLQSLHKSLADRLYYVFVTQDWEGLYDSFWPTHAADLVLDIIDTKLPLRVSDKTPRLPSFDYNPFENTDTAPRAEAGESKVHDSASVSDNENPLSQSGFNVIHREDTDKAGKKRSHSRAFGDETDDKEKSTESEERAKTTATPSAALFADVPSDSAAVVAVEKSWLTRYGNPRVGDLIGSLRELSFYHIPIAHTVFETLLPIAWTQLTQSQREEIAPAISTLLSKAWHARYDYEGWNRAFDRLHPVQTLMAALRKFVPTIPISPSVIQFAGKHFHCWYQAIDMLESQVNVPMAITEGQATIDANSQYYDALAALYRDLNDEDMWNATARRRCFNEFSHSSLAYAQFGSWQRAQDTLFAAMSRHHASEVATDGMNLSNVSRAEEIIWESEWVNAAKHLNQWEVLKDFSVHVGMTEIAWDASWRLGEWNQLKDYVTKYSNQTEFSFGRILMLYHQLHERRYASLEAITGEIDSTIQQYALKEWQSLPSVITMAHLPLLVKAQRLTEIHESATAFDVFLKPPSSSKPLPVMPATVKQHMVTWRDRLPCKWEETTVWSDLLTWRTQFYSMLGSIHAAYQSQQNNNNNTGNNNEREQTTVRVNDSPWTMIKLASAARHQQLSTVCLTTLAKLFSHSSPPLSTDDSFSKLREHVKTCLQNPTEVNTALNIVCATNLDYFATEQKAEMFRLKGEALQHLGFGDESNSAFSACISVCDSYGKGWLSWGHFCDRVFGLKRDLQWADHATVCFIQAIANKHKKALPMIARILCLLNADKDGGLVQRAFTRFYENVPLWVWILWIPQLMTSLARAEGRTCKDILCRIARAYPQAVYYTARSAIIDKKEQWNWHAQISKQRQQQAAAAAAAAAALSTPAPVPLTTPAPAPASTPSPAPTVPTATADTGAAPMDVETNTASSTLTAPAVPMAATPGQLAAVPTPQPQQTPQAQSQAYAESKEGTMPPLESPPTAQPIAQPNAAPARHTVAQPQPQQQQSASESQPRNELSSVLLLDEVVNTLRRWHPILWSETERMLEELNRRFKNEPEEEFLSSIHTLINKCHKAGMGDDAISSGLINTLERFHKQFFIEPQNVSSSSSQRYQSFIQQAKERFEFDFIPASSPEAQRQFPSSLQQLILRLNRWKAHLHYYLNQQPALNKPRLERLSSFLTQTTTHDIEVPGQYVHDREPVLDHHVIIARFTVDVSIPQADVGVFHRRVGMMGDDGKIYHFLVTPSVNHVTKSDERLMQFYVLINRFIKLNKSARQRQLAFHLPIVVPVQPRLRLVKTHESSLTFEQIYERACLHDGVDPQAPLNHYRDALRHTLNVAENEFPTKLHIYNHITTSMIPDTLLTSFLARSFQSLTAYYALRQEFTRQAAITGYLSYILKVGDRAPSKLTLDRHSGRITNHDFYFHYQENLANDSNSGEPVPFRLTRNMQRFVGSLGVDGPLTASILAMNGVLNSNQDLLKSYLQLFFRDDILSYTASRMPIESDSTQRALERQAKERYTQLIVQILRRIITIAPSQHQTQQSAATTEALKRESPQPITAKVQQLVRWATHKSRICQMPPTWMPWF